MKKIKDIERMEKHIVLKQSIFIFCALFLSGCVGMGSKFDCDVDSGGKCAPMHHINKMASQGVFNENSLYGTPKENALARAESKANRKNGYPLNAFDGTPIRSNENIQQIWIGPYEDTNGNYHEPSYVYAVIKKGRWFGEPANVTQD